jgi:uncharacterized protein (TIGR02266 family)
MDDRRTQNRLPVPRVLVKISTPERMRVAYLKDLSEGGVFIRTDKPLALERIVDVDLLAPGRVEPLRLRGRIVRVQNDEPSKLANLQGMGVKFIELSPQQDSALKSLVAEYQNKPEAQQETEVAPIDTIALKQSLETVEVLRAQLAERELELKSEHDRRQELSVRVLALTKELEGIKARGGDGGGVALEALKVELAAARAELGELKARLSQAERNAEQYRQEIAALEQGDAATRRLAEQLAQQKAKQDGELKKLREEIVRHAKVVEQERGSATARASESSRQLESERTRIRELESKGEELAATNSSLTARVAELEDMLEQAKKHVSNVGQTVTDLTATRTRITTLEQALNQEKETSERLRGRERELRGLVSALSAKGDDHVVIDDDGGAPEVSEPALPLEQALPPVPDEVPTALASDPVGLDPWAPSATLVMMAMPPMPLAAAAKEEPKAPFEVPPSPGVAAPAAPAEPAPVGVTSEQLFADLDEAVPAVPAPRPSPESTDIDLDVDVDEPVDVNMDTDWSAAVPPAPTPIPAGPGPEAFLERLRSNDKLVRHATFFDYSASNLEEQNIIGSLMGADRFEDLKVLSRGACTPEQLETFLLRFHQLGLISFN